MTDKQAVQNLTNRLNAVWRLGDRDECSLKHVAHATAAIIAGKTWRDGVDYRRPWDADDKRRAKQEAKLDEAWANVVEFRDELGADKFHTIASQTPFGYNIDWYLESYWSVA